MTTFADLVDKINIELGQASGPDVQLYGSPRINQMLQREYNNAFDKRFWYTYINEVSYTLDGTTGQVTANLTNLIKRFKDIQHVWLDTGTRNPLPMRPNDVNPSLITQPCISPAAGSTTKGFFKILPITTAGSVTIRYRTKPIDFIDTDTINFDEDYLLFKCVANFLVMEGTNLKAAEFYAAQAKQQWQDLIEQDTQLTKSLYSSTISNVDNWNTR